MFTIAKQKLLMFLQIEFIHYNVIDSSELILIVVSLLVQFV
jgi:hypothetical protein